jgi:hypothetical protein
MSAPIVATGTPDLRATSAVDSEPFERGSAVADANRYPGSPPFGDTDVDRLLFRGRAAETDEVLHSILSYDLFLVYAVSGMGKTSLLAAGVLEPLRQRGYFPVMLRVNSPETPMLTLIEAQIRQAGAAAGVEVEHAPTVGADALPADTLWDLLAELEIWRGNDLLEPVLIFDQFEELFTLPWSPDDRATFIEQFGEVVRHHRVPGRDADPARQALAAPNVKIVMCMREDFIGQLEELAVSVPQIMNRRFRLGALDPVQAEAAIREPAELDDARLRTQRFSYSAGAASTVLTFLRTKDERGETVLTDSIDPSQLQIICQHVERTILPRKSAGADGRIEITESDLGGAEGLRRIVGDFYRHVLETFDKRDRKALRHLCETGLISQSGRRLSLEEGEIAAHFGVSRDTLRQLVDLRLVRSEPRVGSVYYELAHDTLTGPILAYRDARRRARRRRLLLAALILAGIAALIVGVLVASRGGDTEVAGPKPAIPLGVGEEESGELASGDDTAAYEVTAAEQPLVVELRPFGFDGVLEVASLGATGMSHTQDAGLLGASEFAVLGAGTGRYRVELSGSSPGEFEVAARVANVRRLSIPGQIQRIRLASTGEPTVLELAGSDNQAFAVSITAQKKDEDVEVPSGVFMQIVAPDGTITHSRANGASAVLSGVGGGDAGTYLLAIGDSSGGTTTSLNVSVTPVETTPVTIGGSTDALLTLTKPQVVFEIDSPNDDPLLFELRDRQGLAFGEIQTPGGDTVFLDPTTFSVVRGGPGLYLAFVSSDSPGPVTLSVDAADGVPVELGVPVSGTIDDEHAVALYTVQASGDGPLVTEVKSDSTLDAVLSLVSTDESAVEPIDFSGTDASEQMVLPDGTDGSLLFAVTSYEHSSGTFEFSVRPAEVTSIAVGETAERHLDAGALALYTVEATAEPFGFAVTSTDGLLASVSATSPDGEEFALSDNMFVSTGVAGEYTITARNVDEAGDFYVSVDSFHEGAQAGESATATIGGPGEIELFALPFVSDPTTIISVTTEGDLSVEATITDAFGNVLVYADHVIAGTDTILVDGGSGSDRVIVNGISGSGTVQIDARGISPIAVTPDSQQTFDVAKRGDATVYTFGPTDVLQVVDVHPAEGAAVEITVVDSYGGSSEFEPADSTSPATLLIDTRGGPAQVVLEATQGPGAVTLSSTGVATVPLAVGAPRSGSIRSPAEMLGFDVDVGSDLDFDELLRAVVSPANRFDVQIAVVDPYSAVEAIDDYREGDAEEAYLASGPGVYRVVVAGVGESTGDFQLLIESTE